MKFVTPNREAIEASLANAGSTEIGNLDTKALNQVLFSFGAYHVL